MAISFVGASTLIATTIGSASPSVHASTTDGDLVILVIEHPNNGPVAAAGFEEICDLSTGSSGTGAGLWVGWTKYDSATWQSPSTPSAGDHLSCALLTYRGAEVDEVCYDAKATDTAASSTSVTFPGLTTSVASTVVVNILSHGTDTSTAQASGWTNASLGSLTERFDAATVNGNGGGIAVADGTLAGAGSSGSTTATLAGASIQCRLTMALREAANYGGYPSTPTVASVTTGGDTSSTGSHSITLPSGINAGDLLIAAYALDATPTVTWDNSTAGTWTLEAEEVAGSSNKLVVYSKLAVGTEDGLTLNVATATNEAGNWAVFRITGASGDVEVSAATAQTTANQNPKPTNALTPSWGAVDTLWLGLAARDDATTASKNRSPRWTSGSSEANGGSLGGSLGCLHYAYIAERVASQKWYGTSLSANEQWVAILLGVEPSSSGYTLAADGGTFNETGQAAGLLHGHSLTAEPGAFNFTGADAGLTYGSITGYTLGADAEAFAFSGQAAGLLHGRALSAENGGLTATGQAANLVYAPIAVPAVWNVMANMTLTNGNLTATGVGGGLNGNARSSLPLTGKHYVELTYSGAGSNLPGCGIANTSENNAPGAGDNHSVSWSTQFGSGGIFLNGTNLGSIGLWSTASDVLCIAVDRPNGLAWFRKNNGNWNGSGTANPATGAGGFDISALGGGDWHIYAYVATQTYTVTANFGASAYAYTAPAGFGALGLAAYELEADSGAFTFAGQDAALIYGALGHYTLSSEADAFTLNGQSATLLKGYKVGVQPISYIVQGQQFTQVLRQTTYPGSTGDHIFVFGNEAYQGNRNTFAYPPEVDWPLKVSDLGNIHRFEVRPGDKGFTSDDPAVVNRSEIVFWEAMEFDTDYIFSFAFMIENQDRTLASIFHTLFQFHHEGDAGDTVTAPPFMMTYAASDGNINFHHRTSNDDPLTVAPAFAFLGFAPATPGQWMNVHIEVRWSPSGAGHYRIWVNGVQKVSYSGATGYNDAVAPRGQYGAYRNATDQTFAVQFANMEWSAGSGLSGRLASPLPIDDSALEVGRLLTAGAGSYALAGQAPGLTATRTLPLAFGQFTLNGQDVSFRFSRVFQAEAGAVAVQGQDAILAKAAVVHRVLPADAGEFLMGGQADLRGPPWTPVGPGHAAWATTPEHPATWTLVAVNPETWTLQ